MANPTQTVTVETLPVITHQSVRCITTDLLATLYGTKPTNISTNFLSNADRFVSGKHFFKLEGDELRKFKELHKSSKTALVEISPRAKHLTLWTERGAARHAKMLDTDQAWDVFEKLEDAYFGVSEDRPVETLTPSEAQTLKEIVDAKLAHLPPELQQKGRGEVWSRVQNKFRANSYTLIPRTRLAEAILYVTQMELRGVPGPAPEPTITTISPAQQRQLANAVQEAMSGWVFTNEHSQHAYNALRVIFHLEHIADLPASDFERAIFVVDQIRGMNWQFLSWIGEVREAYLREYVMAGGPWTPWLKREWKKRMQTALPKRPNWLEIQQQLALKGSGTPVAI